MKTRSVIIRRIALGPLAQWGFVAGALIACFPAFVCSWILFALVASLKELIAGWRDVGLTVLGQRISFDLVQVLNLQNALQSLTNVAGLGVFGILLLALGVALVLGIFGALVMSALGAFYNTTGRIRLELEEVDSPVPLVGGASATNPNVIEPSANEPIP